MIVKTGGMDYEFKNLHARVENVENKLDEISRALIAIAFANQPQENLLEKIAKRQIAQPQLAEQQTAASQLAEPLVAGRQNNFFIFFANLFSIFCIALIILFAIFFYVDSQSAKNINLSELKIEKIEKYIGNNSHAKINSPYVLPTNFAPKSLRDAALDGLPLALFEVGLRYYNSKQNKQAAKWFEYAAEKEIALAQYALGVLYEKGIGVEKKISKAIYWYERGANNGNVKSMYNFAVLATSGAEKNLATAFFWFTKAAEFGLADSQYNLAMMYEYGNATKKSYIEAYKWYSLAARGDDVDAQQKLAEVQKQMSKQEIKTARQKIANWQYKEINIDANFAAIPDNWKI